jgi:anti-sigma B factor antagonist
MNSAEHPLSVRVEQDEGSENVRIFLSGELDVSTDPDLLAQLQESHAHGVTEITVDLSELEFVDSTGLSVLVTMHKRARDEKTRFVLASPLPQFLNLIQVAGLNDYFDLDGSASTLS